jgi:hypothetical protein
MALGARIYSEVQFSKASSMRGNEVLNYTLQKFRYFLKPSLELVRLKILNIFMVMLCGWRAFEKGCNFCNV